MKVYVLMTEEVFYCVGSSRPWNEVVGCTTKKEEAEKWAGRKTEESDDGYVAYYYKEFEDVV